MAVVNMIRRSLLLGALSLVVGNTVALASNFENCAAEADQHFWDDSPFQIQSDGKILANANVPVAMKATYNKSATDESGPVEIYSFIRPSKFPDENTLSQTIKVRRVNGDPTEISSTVMWKGANDKDWTGSDTSTTTYSYKNGTCSIERKEIHMAPDKRATVTYDKQLCDDINSDPFLSSADFIKCSEALDKISIKIKDFSHELVMEEREEKKAGLIKDGGKDFAFKGVAGTMRFIAACQNHGLPESSDACLWCMVNPMRGSNSPSPMPFGTKATPTH
jgi:hypothetical protein